ncbi:hypothetical protein DL96DRAFT_1810992 [Flagelloscypha sp. PMI_526]|nr:hypothetical protein DL96DRAFT_1810992 [Flagelloscypha sp. PMI_526]
MPSLARLFLALLAASTTVLALNIGSPTDSSRKGHPSTTPCHSTKQNHCDDPVVQPNEYDCDDVYCPAKNKKGGVLVSGNYALNADGHPFCKYENQKKDCVYDKETHVIFSGDKSTCATMLDKVTYTCPNRDGLTIKNFNLEKNVLECTVGGQVCLYSSVTGDCDSNVIFNQRNCPRRGDRCTNDRRRRDNFSAVQEKQVERRRAEQLASWRNLD